MAKNAKKYGGLPDIDQMTPDVLETPDSDRFMPLSVARSAAPRTGARMVYSGETAGDADEAFGAPRADDDLLDAAGRARAHPRRGPNPSSNPNPNIELVRDAAPPGARRAFERSVVSADDADFSDSVAPRPAAAGYRVYRVVDGADSLEPQLLSLSTAVDARETAGPAAELERLRRDVARLEPLLSDPDARVAHSLDAHVTQLLAQCRDAPISQSATLESSSAARRIRADLESVTAAPTGTLTAAPSRENLFNLDKLDGRLARLEQALGATDGAADAPLAAVVSKIESQLDALVEPQGTERVRAQLAVLNAELARTLELRQRLDVLGPSGLPSRSPSVSPSATPSPKARRTVATPAAAISPQQVQRIDAAFKLLREHEPTFHQLPHVQARLVALRQLHNDAAAVADALQLSAQRADAADRTLDSLDGALSAARSSLADSAERMRANVSALQPVLDGLSSRLGALEKLSVGSAPHEFVSS